MIPYIEDFYSQQDADELFEFIKAQPFVRPPNPRNKTYRLKRLSFPGYSPPVVGRQTSFKRPSNYDVSRPVEKAPELYKKFAKKLSAYAGKEINYMSTIGYLPDDHMDFHQHEEDKKREDQTVWVLSLGAVHPVAIRPKGVKDKSQWEIIHPKHGSLYVLPSGHNLTHEHAVLYGNDSSYGGLRLAINTKHIPTGLSPDEMRKACRRPAGAPITIPEAKPRKEVVIYRDEDTGLAIYRCRKNDKCPRGSVYVGRAAAGWTASPFGNHSKEDGFDDFAEYARVKMSDGKFRKQLDKLRGKNLLCWCKPGDDCHAITWLKLANAPMTPMEAFAKSLDPNAVRVW